VELWRRPPHAVAGFGGNIQRFSGLDAGESRRLRHQLEADYRRFYGATVGFAGRGEMIPNPDSYCEIDPNTVDVRHPGAALQLQVERHEINQAKHMQDTFRASSRTWAARCGTPAGACATTASPPAAA
jgi:hypothetical protein